MWRYLVNFRTFLINTRNSNIVLNCINSRNCVHENLNYFLFNIQYKWSRHFVKSKMCQYYNLWNCNLVFYSKWFGLLRDGNFSILNQFGQSTLVPCWSPKISDGVLWYVDFRWSYYNSRVGVCTPVNLVTIYTITHHSWVRTDFDWLSSNSYSTYDLYESYSFVSFSNRNFGT